MRIAALFAVLLACAGCSARTNVNATSGSSVTQSSAQVQVQSGSGFVTLFGLTILGALAFEAHGLRSLGGFPFMTVFDTPQGAPELAPERRVNEQDCTKPIEDVSANLRCR